MPAIKVFAQYGYKEATVREICQVAQSANINSVSYYYGSKEKLYNAVLDFMFAGQRSRLEHYAPPKNPAEFLQNLHKLLLRNAVWRGRNRQGSHQNLCRGNGTAFSGTGYYRRATYPA